MATVAEDDTTTEEHSELVDGHPEEHDHPSDWAYIKIALILAVLTALEVFTYFESVHSLGRNALIVLLMVMMIAKIVLVMAWFMHLKFDNRMFTRVFMFGVILALAVYIVMLSTFLIWD